MPSRLKRFFHRFSAVTFRKPVQADPVFVPFPPMVMIDTTTRCNLACRHCPNGQLKERPGFVGDMPAEIFRKIIDEIAQENPATVVRPFNSGEPLMRKDIEALIRYAKDKGIGQVSINTNGLLLNCERSIAIIESGLDHIEISIDAATAATYRNIRGSGSFDMLRNQVNQLLELRITLKSKLKVSVSFVRQESNRAELDLFVDYWQGKVDRVYIREFHEHNRLVEGDGLSRKALGEKRHPCPYLWDRMIIHHDGRVRFCESDWECRHPIGDVTRQSIKDIWNCEEYRRLRDSHLRGTFAHPFCRDCSDWRVIK